MIIKRFAIAVIVFSLVFFDCGCNKRPSNGNTRHSEIINIDEIIRFPDKYKDFLEVKGTVIKIDETKNIFLLGCKDACIFMPVKYLGQMPNLKSEIIVYGKLIKQKNGRYIFHGKEVKKK